MRVLHDGFQGNHTERHCFAHLSSAEAAHRAGNFRISNLPEFSSAYPVRLVQYWDKKSNATIFDVEIDGVRTMICRRAGKFKNAE